MKPYGVFAISLVLLILLVALAACASATAAPTSTSTPPPVPTNTPLPSATPVPSPTPDVAATQKADTFSTLLNTFVHSGYLDSTAGDIVALNPAESDWNHDSWSPNANKPLSDFLFSAHFSWNPAKGNPQALGCGVLFGAQQVTGGSLYQLAFSKTGIDLGWEKYPNLYVIGKSAGTGRVDFTTKTETDFAVLVHNLNAYVSFDGAVTKYALSADRPISGSLVLIRSFVGTCKMTDMMLWTPR